MTSEAKSAWTIANWTGRVALTLLLLGGGWLAVLPVVHRTQWAKQVPAPVIAAYLAIVALVLIWLLYRVSRLGVRFDDHGVAIRSFMRTHRFAWPEVSYFEERDVSTGPSLAWVLVVVLRDGREFSCGVDPNKGPLIMKIAARYGIRAGLWPHH